MKIGLPGNSQPKSNKEGTAKKSNQPKSNKKQNKKPAPVKSNSPVSWREKDGFATAIISRKLIKIDLTTLDIFLPNGFKISNNKSLEDAKKKAISFFSS